MKWTASKFVDDQSEHDRWDVPLDWLPMHYFEALNCLFRIENALRILVYVVLKRDRQEKWTDITLATDDSQPLNLKTVAERRAEGDQQVEYLTGTSSCPLMQLTAGELVGLIFSEAYWKIFKHYLPGSQGQMKAKLREIACIRNALAHFRLVTQEQVAIVKQNGAQVLSKFEVDFREMLFGKSVTAAKSWSKTFQMKKSAPLVIQCKSRISKSGKWAYLYVRSPARIQTLDMVGDNCHINVSVLDLEKLLHRFPSVRHKCVVATEKRCGIVNWDGDSSPPAIYKVIRLVFPNSPGNLDPAKAVNFLPPELSEKGTEQLSDGSDLVKSHRIIAVEQKVPKSASTWMVIANCVDATQSEFVENWGTLDEDNTAAHPLTSLSKYPWIRDSTSASALEV